MITHPLRALIVEDSEVNLLLIEAWLKEWGYEVEVSTSGFEAMKKIFRESGFDAILMDLGLPGLNGIETTMLIREYEKSIGRKRSLIIGVTAYTMPSEQEEFLKAGVDTVVTKPVALSRLKSALELNG